MKADITSEDARHRARLIEASRRALALLQLHHGAPLPAPRPAPPPSAPPSDVQRYRSFSVIPPSGTKPVSPVMAIIERVAGLHGMTAADILSPNRTGHVVRARHHAMYLAATQTHLSLPAIGLVFRRDHSSITHGIRAHAARTGAPWTGRRGMPMQRIDP